DHHAVAVPGQAHESGRVLNDWPILNVSWIVDSLRTFIIARFDAMIRSRPRFDKLFLLEDRRSPGDVFHASWSPWDVPLPPEIARIAPPAFDEIMPAKPMPVPIVAPAAKAPEPPTRKSETAS